MQFAKKAFLFLVVPVFIILLLATSVDVGFIKIATRPQNVKNLVNNADFKLIIDSEIEHSKPSTMNVTVVSFADPEVRKAAYDSFGPPLKESSGQIIDGVYAWLEGKTPKPSFKVDLTDARNQFVSEVADSARKRAAKLPVCQYTVKVSGYNVFTTKCRPPGVSPVQIAQQVRYDLISGQGFFQNPVITADNIKSGNSDQTIFDDQLKGAPRQYQLAKKTPFILSFLTVLAAIGVVFLSKDWKVGLRRVGIIMISTGVVMLIFAWGSNRVVSTKLIPRITNEDPILQQYLRSWATDVTHQIDKNYWLFGGLYTILGGAFMSTVYVLSKRQAPKTYRLKRSTEQPEPETDSKTQDPKLKSGGQH
jgi:hypothetical protein